MNGGIACSFGLGVRTALPGCTQQLFQNSAWSLQIRSEDVQRSTEQCGADKRRGSPLSEYGVIRLQRFARMASNFSLLVEDGPPEAFALSIHLTMLLVLRSRYRRDRENDVTWFPQ
jgi:hypothetical protein